MTEEGKKAKKPRKKRTKTGRAPSAKSRTLPKKEREQPPRIKATAYNALWQAYCKTQNITAAAKEARVSCTTAAKFITGSGHPEAGMEPIRDRWLRVQARAQEEQELDLLSFRRKEKQNALQQLTILHGEMQLAMADVKRRLDAYKDAKGKNAPERDMMTRDIVTAYDKTVRLVEHLLGGPDMVVGGVLVNDPLNALTPEEAMEYATTGKLPATVGQAIAKGI